MQIERQCHREKEMSCLLHLPFRLLPFTAFLSFPFYPNLKEMISHIHLLLYMKSMTTDRTCQMRQYISMRVYDSSPNVLHAQWAVGGLSARQKGSAAEWGESQAS